MFEEKMFAGPKPNEMKRTRNGRDVSGFEALLGGLDMMIGDEGYFIARPFSVPVLLPNLSAPTPSRWSILT
jgi:hypothetical protein